MATDEDLLTVFHKSVPPERLSMLREDLLDFRKSGLKHQEAADRFSAGLDKVVDVLLILVLKFGRATSMIIAMIVILGLCCVTLVVSTIHVMTLKYDVADLIRRQEAFARVQERLEKATNSTQEQVSSTNKKIEETQATIEAAPKIEIDKKTGKPKIVVPEKPQ